MNKFTDLTTSEMKKLQEDLEYVLSSVLWL